MPARFVTRVPPGFLISRSIKSLNSSLPLIDPNLLAANHSSCCCCCCITVPYAHLNHHHLEHLMLSTSLPLLLLHASLGLGSPPRPFLSLFHTSCNNSNMCANVNESCTASSSFLRLFFLRYKRTLDDEMRGEERR